MKTMISIWMSQYLLLIPIPILTRKAVNINFRIKVLTSLCVYSKSTELWIFADYFKLTAIWIYWSWCTFGLMLWIPLRNLKINTDLNVTIKSMSNSLCRHNIYQKCKRRITIIDSQSILFSLIYVGVQYCDFMRLHYYPRNKVAKVIMFLTVCPSVTPVLVIATPL